MQLDAIRRDTVLSFLVIKEADTRYPDRHTDRLEFIRRREPGIELLPGVRNARRKPAFGDRDTFVPYEAWLRKGWPRGDQSRPPAEFVLRCKLPITAPYLIGVKHL